MVFQVSVKGVSKKFQKWFKEVSMDFKKVLRVFQERLNGVSRDI